MCAMAWFAAASGLKRLCAFAVQAGEACDENSQIL